MEFERVNVTPYDREDRDYMRRFLQKASPIIYSIASDKIPLGSYASAEMTDLLADIIGYEKRKQDDEDALQDLISDRQSLINLYGAVKKEPGFLPLYVEIGNLLRKYGLFDEEVDLLENAIAENRFIEADLVSTKSRLTRAISLRQTDYADMSEAEQIAEDLRKAIQKKPTDRDEIEPLIHKCSDDVVLYEFACNDSLASDLTFVRAEAARRIKSRDYQYALDSHAQRLVKRTVVLNLFDTLKGDDCTLTFVFKRSENDEVTINHFTGAKCDGKPMTRGTHYTAEKGSVKIELQTSYLNTLKVGKHTLTAMFDDGEDASAIFTVLEATTYTVIFNTNGHGTAPASQKVVEGNKAKKPANLTAQGYTFGGWYTEAACQNAFNFNTPITKDITLYAKWTKASSGGQSGSGGSGRNAPRTGDTNNTVLWAALMVISILAISGAVIAYRKRRPH